MDSRLRYAVVVASALLVIAAVFLVLNFRRPPSPVAVRPSPDAASACIIAATGRQSSRGAIYSACMAASRQLRDSRNKQPLKDHDAVTGSILEIYAAYALDRSTPKGRTQSDALLQDAGARLVALSQRGASADVRKRAALAHSCLIARAPACLKEWAHYQ